MTEARYIKYRDPDTFHVVVTEYRVKLVLFLNANDFLWEFVTPQYYEEVRAQQAADEAYAEQFMKQFPDYGLLP